MGAHPGTWTFSRAAPLLTPRPARPQWSRGVRSPGRGRALRGAPRRLRGVGRTASGRARPLVLRPTGAPRRARGVARRPRRRVPRRRRAVRPRLRRLRRGGLRDGGGPAPGDDAAGGARGAKRRCCCVPRDESVRRRLRRWGRVAVAGRPRLLRRHLRSESERARGRPPHARGDRRVRRGRDGGVRPPRRPGRRRATSSSSTTPTIGIGTGARTTASRTWGSSSTSWTGRWCSSTAAAWPSPGDLVFFDDTYDRNRNGRADDRLTHVGIVEYVVDGTVVFVHRGGRAVALGALDPRRPAEASADGRVLNSPLRAKGARAAGVPVLAGALFAGYGRIDPARVRGPDSAR